MEAFAYVYNPFLDRASYYTLKDQNLGEKLEIKPWGLSGQDSHVFYQSHPFALGYSWDYESIPITCKTVSREDHVDYVYKIIQHIHTTGLKKVVAARQKVLPLPNFSLEEMLQKLVSHFPHTLVSAFYTPQSGLWIGASPELLGYLVQKNFTTISLAGTIDKSNTFHAKEIEEERWVRDYIYSVLLNHCNMIKEEQKERCFGSLKHLETEFQAKLDKSVYFSSLIDEIHPSPALAGFPKKDAIEYIAQNESINRKYYSGSIVQMIDSENQYAFGLIRTAQCADRQMVLYAGGGITKDSDPSLEYEETEKKMTILELMLTK